MSHGEPKTVAIAPGPSDALGPIHLLRYLAANPLAYYQKLWHQYGPLVRWKMGPRVFYLVTDPSHVRHILVENAGNYIRGQSYQKLRRLLGSGMLTNDGIPWKRSREALHGLFTPKATLELGTAIAHHTDLLVERWSDSALHQSPIDIATEFQRFMIGLTGEALFGQDWRKDAEEIRANLKEITDYSFNVKNLLLPETIPTPANRRFKAAQRAMHDFLDSVIDKRDNLHEKATVLSIMKAMHDDNTLTRDELREELLTFLAAGADTTAQALTWTLFLLATHPQHLENIVGGEEKVLLETLEESLRLYPPVWGLARWVHEDDLIDGYRIEAGSMIILGTHLINHDPNRWKNPESFEPERFSDGAEDSSRAAFAFGAGAHTCIGQHVAMKVLRHVVPRLCKGFRVHVQNPEEVSAYPGFTLYPEHGVSAQVMNRSL